MAALLQEIGGGEIDGDAPGRERQPDGAECCAHALPALAHRLVRQADDGEGRHAAHAELHLRIHLQAVDALEGDRLDPRHHELRIPSAHTRPHLRRWERGSPSGREASGGRIGSQFDIPAALSRFR